MSGILDHAAPNWDRAGAQKRPSFSRHHASVPLRTAALSCARSQGSCPFLSRAVGSAPAASRGGNHGRGGGEHYRPMQGRPPVLVPRREVGARGDQGGNHGRGGRWTVPPYAGASSHSLVPRREVGPSGDQGGEHGRGFGGPCRPMQRRQAIRLSRAVRSAPAATKVVSTAGVSVDRAAQCKGVKPFASRAVRSAPAATRVVSPAGVLVNPAAKCRGVKPFASRAVRSAPAGDQGGNYGRVFR